MKKISSVKMVDANTMARCKLLQPYFFSHGHRDLGMHNISMLVGFKKSKELEFNRIKCMLVTENKFA
jgi:hypothetical protein